ncbi:MAG: signal peptide peptidase SppA [Acidobacteria bacterium]|nr:signal peptide peptidase SppA [Acidobacteriota bacterium]
MRKAIVLALVVIAVLALGAALIFGILAVAGVFGSGSVAGKTILELDLEQGLVEYIPEDPAAKLFMSDVLTIHDVVAALEKARTDERVVGFYARIGSGGIGMAQAQELRDAVKKFRESGKPAFAFAETFGEYSPGNVGYYVATAFDEIWLQPSGDIGLTGFALEGQFLRGTFDKLDIKPRMDQRYEYKNAMNQYTHTAFTEPHREAFFSLADGWQKQMERGIAEGRKLDAAAVRGIVDRGPYLGQEAVAAGLVDGVAYRDEVLAKLRERTKQDKAGLLFVSKYLERGGRPWTEGRVIAIVNGSGPVVRGETAFDPLGGSTVMGSDTVAGALRAAIEDEDVEAIVLRVDSPGGSYVASDTIWRETLRAKDAGKPLIVSMGDLAASGGYFVAMAADKIVAQPGTITGSIGVLGGKLLTTGLWNKLGVTFDEVHTAENALMFSSTQDYTEYGWQRHQAWLDRVYADFTGKVAEGRSIPIERVREIAKGRVWTGEEAKKIGLVDELGGLTRAIELAREAAGIPADDDIEARAFPRPKTLFEALSDKGAESSDPQAAIAIMRRAIETMRPLVRLAETAGVIGRPPQVLEAPALPEPR